jgi:hypothetical protein
MEIIYTNSAYTQSGFLLLTHFTFLLPIFSHEYPKPSAKVYELGPALQQAGELRRYLNIVGNS